MSLIVSCHDAIKAVFETYALFERASGSKLNQAKSKGLWLGGWCGRTDPSVALEWSSSKIKILGVFVGVGDLDSNNWRPHIEAGDHVLKSWRSRSLSFRGKALVINALALSRVWYVASLIHIAVLHTLLVRFANFELCTLICTLICTLFISLDMVYICEKCVVLLVIRHLAFAFALVLCES